ncbi:zinc metalloprotease HtpX [Paenibacillus sp. FSL H8-0548]|uniref:zinc metalloprotease HtpX n=1 Tax=Paenibacillus sp. FSL H8-0548 TaxID=1920422 RepID=UPI00096EEB00|nr:zinc metalloprotease HtpX [Paenibacillus sp. FSL H8-0548]OMF28688.1 zinc metalloprotease HtpX [Paenibacillus sp. FSL H8-0548]
MLYKQIEQNKRKTVLLVLLFSVIVLGAGIAVGYLGFGDIWIGAIIAAVILLVYVPITYMSASSQVLRMSGAVLANEETHKQLYHIVEELCIPARIPMPKIYVINDPSPNAFATGIKPEKGAVAFTTGLLEQLNREELEAVAAHELAHIRNYDIRLMTISIALISVVAILADIGSRMLFTQRRNDNKKTHPAFYIVALIFILLSPLAARFVHLAVSRNREYLADATAVELTRNSLGLQNALRKISSSSLDVRKAKKSTASLYISSPFSKLRKAKKTSWFSTHPSMESRIERLGRM